MLLKGLGFRVPGLWLTPVDPKPKGPSKPSINFSSKPFSLYHKASLKETFHRGGRGGGGYVLQERLDESPPPPPQKK